MFETKEEKEVKAKAKAEAKVEAEEKAKAEAAEKAEVEAEERKIEAEEKMKAVTEETNAKEADEVTDLIEEATSLGIKIPRTSIASFKSQKPGDIEKEKARIAKNLITWLKTMIAKHKASAKLKPIEKRKALLVSRLKAVKARDRAYTYSDAVIKAWLEELEMINNNPKAWNKTTANGTKPYTPSSKKKKTALDILDGMDLE